MKERIDGLKAWVEKNETKLEVAFFVGGFVLDIFLLSTPDDLFGVLQQVVYMAIIASLIHYELLYRLRKWRPGKFARKFWSYRNLALHFSFGSLLNLYSLFYIKSASILSSFMFLGIMLAMILANELPFVKKAKVSMKVAMYAICVFSFFSIIYPILFGFVGWVPFGFALATTVGVFLGHVKLLERSFEKPTVLADTLENSPSLNAEDRTSPQSPALLHRAMLWPGISVAFVFLVFYTFGWIPPVPLSVNEQGVYHNVQKQNGKFYLSFEKTWWKFWQTSDTTFFAEPGDKIYFYAQIYSPTRISDVVKIHWLTKDRKGTWITSDRIPMSIQGGREAGFRGFAFKSNYTPGEWQVRVETTGGIEISRLYFDVIARAKSLDSPLSETTNLREDDPAGDVEASELVDQGTGGEVAKQTDAVISSPNLRVFEIIER